MENFKTHPDYPDLLIGDRGTIRSVIVDPKGRKRATHVNRIGYECIIYRVTPKSYRTDKVHRLVAKAHVPNPDNLPDVNHIDHNKLNNRADNLEWTTHADNIRKARRFHGAKWKTGANAKPVIATPVDGGPPVQWPSARAFAIFTGNPHRAANVSTAIKIGSPAYGFTWAFVEKPAQHNKLEAAETQSDNDIETQNQ